MKLAGYALAAQRYRTLKDYLLRNGFIHHVPLPVEESEPFVMGDIFYGQTFEDAVDTLDPYLRDTIFSPALSPSI